MLREQDQLVVAKLDCLGRSQVEVIHRLNALQQQRIYVRMLDGLIDTQALGNVAPYVVGLLTGLLEVERSLIQERNRESVEHRRKTGGNLGGRPKTNAKKESLVPSRNKASFWSKGKDGFRSGDHCQNRQKGGDVD